MVVSVDQCSRPRAFSCCRQTGSNTPLAADAVNAGVGGGFKSQVAHGLDPSAASVWIQFCCVMETDVLLLVTIDLRQADLDAFDRYEANVIGLIQGRLGNIERRVRTLDGQTEVHILSFPDERSFEDFLNDPKRLALAESLGRSLFFIDFLLFINVVTLILCLACYSEFDRCARFIVALTYSLARSLS